MTNLRPLLVFDTNILLDIWLGRDGNQSVLLLTLAEEGVAELLIPEYVLIEFRGTALRWLRDERSKLDKQVRALAKEWLRSEQLDEGAELIASGGRVVERRLSALHDTIDLVDQRIRAVARVVQHTLDLHFRGDLRFLSGRPPDRPVDGLKDCRIYEAVLDIARSEEKNARQKVIFTRDSDFEYEEIRKDLGALGFLVRKDPGRLYGELRTLPA